MSLLQVNNLKKVYRSKLSTNKVTALKDVSFLVEPGEYVAIMGESGSGKSTLLNILASLDKPTQGNVLLNGTDITKLPESKICNFRRNHLGFIFQDFNLLDTFNNKDNILLPMVLAQKKVKEMDPKLNKVAKVLHIDDLLMKYPYELSGGQKQRIAAARALIMDPEIILADEPTGALDSKNTQDLLNLFEQINEKGQTILMVTHSILAASHAKRVLFIRDGKIFHQIYKGDLSTEEMADTISKTITLMNRKEGLYA